MAGLAELRLVELPNRHLPKNLNAAEQAATRFRKLGGLGGGPIVDLARVCESLGLYSYAAPLGENGPDGACVEVEYDAAKFGAAVINGDAPAGRRRMTLAHELGHWLFGDAYDAEASWDGERLINAFAVHFLAPRAGVTHVWKDHAEYSERDRALIVGATFRLSWSATIGQLTNLGIIDQLAFGTFSQFTPSSGDYLRLSLDWDDELAAPSLSPEYVAACLRAYSDERITEGKTLELLRNVVSREQLPSKSALTMEDFRASFENHSFSGRDD